MHVTLTPPLRSVLRTFARLRRSTSGLAIVEFALSAPFLMLLGTYGLESANLAVTTLRLSQISANLADTTSRIGLSSPSALKVIRESDINDAFQGVRIQAGSIPLATKGRVILSSLEQDATAKQYIHWSRCLGKKSYASQYGLAGDGVSHVAGMGATGSEIKAPAGFAVMFVEIVYDYQPLISNKLLGVRQIKTKAAFLVRDNRNLATTSNPQPTTAIVQDCSKDTV
ncbi:MAG: hypothetical protein JWP15_1317 [Alphaproteobacteria bacterium]|nr:hypothetical protein [Alphaproteobacteria bacterium]